MASSDIRIRMNAEVFEQASLMIEAELLEILIEEHDEWTEVGQFCRHRLEAITDRLAVLELLRSTRGKHGG